MPRPSGDGRPSRITLVLVVASALGCSPTSTPPPASTLASPAGVEGSAPSTTASPGPSPAAPSSPPRVLPAHQVIDGPSVEGTFDAATDGSVIAWSSGAIDVDAPELWRFAPATGRATLVFRSNVTGAILANVAVRDGTHAFAEVTARPDGTSTWRFDVVDASGTLHVLDRNDVPPGLAGVLPMAAISDEGLLWATTHVGAGDVLSCELRYASLEDLVPRTVAAQPCDRTEFWHPRSDGQRFVYGTVEYGPDGTADDRHVYLVTDADLAHPRRLDPDGEAALPAILGDTVIWKTAGRDFNMLSFGGLVESSVTQAEPRPIGLGGPLGGLTMPTLGPGFFAAEGQDAAGVWVWDRSGARPVEIDRLGPGDPGFLSGTRIAGDVLMWLYTSATRGGGDREIRWLILGGP